MAVGGLPEFLHDLQENLTCSLCTDLLTNPKALPCQHGFCYECLNQHLQARTKAGKIKCPLCCLEFTVPENGIEGFAAAFYPASQLEIYKKYTQSEVQPSLPSESREIHVPVKEQKVIESAIINCKFHNKALTELCETCNQLICESCSSLPHKTHRRVPVKSAVDKHKSNLASAQKRMLEQKTLRENSMQETQVAIELSFLFLTTCSQPQIRKSTQGP